MVQLSMAYTGEGVQLAGVDEVPLCPLCIFKSLHEAVLFSRGAIKRFDVS